MSLIYGIINTKGEVESRDAQILKDELSLYPFDEFDSIEEENIVAGLYSIRLRKPPFPKEKCQLGEEGIRIIADARLDYREDLLKKLELDSNLLYRLSDTELILKAYQKWNRNCVHHLEGDFCFILYNSRKKQIWGARDPIGLRPFFFIQKNNQFYFSTSIKGLLKLNLFPHDVNEQFWTHRFFQLDCPPSATPHQNLYQLPIGNELEVKENTFKNSSYFKWGKSSIPKSPEERASKLREIIEKAVESRTYSDYEVGCQLSGGLDSSSIAAIVSRRFKKKNSQQKLWTVSAVADEEIKNDRDERPWVELFSKEFENVNTHFVSSPKEVEYNSSHNQLFVLMRLRRYSGFSIERQLKEYLMQKNCKTVLTGWRGDHFASRHSMYSINDLWINGNWGYLLKNMGKIAKWRGRTSFHILKQLIKANAPFELIESEMLSFLNSEWLEELNESIEDIQKKENRWKLRDVKWDLWRFLPINKHVSRFYMEDISFLDAKPLINLHPLSDARVISYALNFQGTDYHIDGMDRGIFRKAMVNVLPEEIRVRNNKGLYNFHDISQLREILPQILKANRETIPNSKMCKHIDSEKVLQIINEFLDQPNKKMDIYFALSLNFLGYLLYFATFKTKNH